MNDMGLQQDSDRICKPELVISGVGFSYSEENVVFTDLNMELESGSCEAVLGENGAGKSTLYSLILGLRKPERGIISTECNRRQIGYLPQVLFSSPMLTVRETATLWASLERADPDKVWDGIHDRLAQHTKEKMLSKANQKASRLSYGEMRLFILSILFALPKKRLFLLDEPTTGLDISARATFWELIESRPPGSSVLWSTHEFGEVNHLTNRIRLLINQGSRSFGSLEEFADSEAEKDATEAFKKLTTRHRREQAK